MPFKIDRTPRLKRAYKKLSPDDKQSVQDAIKTLVKGSPYPNSLRVKKMRGHKSIWEASPTMSCRLTFEFNNPDYIVLRNVGKHDLTLGNP